MRSHKFVFVMGLIVLGAFGLMLGCSSSDTPTSRSMVDPDYAMAVDEVNNLVDTSLSLVSQRLLLVSLGNQGDTFQKLPDLLLTTFGVDSVVQGDGWLIMYDAELGAAYSNFYLDSIQFRSGQTILPTSSGADLMTIKRYWQVTALDTTQSYQNYDMVGQFTFTGVNTSQITVNASVALGINTKQAGASSNTYQNCEINSTMTNMVFSSGGSPSSSGCPASGTCQASVGLASYRDTNPMAESQWQIMLTFENGLGSASVTGLSIDTTYAQQFCSFE